MSLPRALIIKQHFSFSSAAVFAVKALKLRRPQTLEQVNSFLLGVYLENKTKPLHMITQ